MAKIKAIISVVLMLTLMTVTMAASPRVVFGSRAMSLKEAFDALEQQTGKSVAYNESVVNLDLMVQTPNGEVSLEAALKAILKGTGTDFVISDSQIVVVKAEAAPAPAVAPAPARQAPAKQSPKYSGIVYDSDGLPLPGATVVVAQGGQWSLTDRAGRFEVDAKPGDNLLVSFLGYTDQTVTLGDDHVISVFLAAEQLFLDEVVVVGMNNRQTRRSITGAISTIQTKELVQSPVANISNALAGKMPGLMTVQYSGEPGADASTLYIRGLGTYGTTTPLVVIDGLPRNKSDLDMIDANEIESITILKDASSSSLYGIQGANGVVVVTTRRGGGDEQPRITFNVQQAMQQPIRLPKMMTSYEQALYNRALDYNNGQPVRYTEDVLDALKNGTDPYLFPSINWFDVVLKDHSWQQQYNMNISGSAGKNHKINYFISGSYIKQGTLLNHEDVFQDNYGVKSKYDRYNFRSNIDVQATKRLNIRVDLAARLETRIGPSNSFSYIFGQITNRQPSSQAIWNPNGTLAAGSGLEIPTKPGNPYGLITQSGYYNNGNNVMYGTLSAKYDLDFIAKGLSLQGFFSFENTNSLNRVWSQTFDAFWYRGKDEDGNDIYLDFMTKSRLAAITGSYVERYTYYDVRLNYDRSFGQNNINGQILANRTLKNIQGSEYMYAYQGLSVRGTYNYAQRYFAEFNLGYNGSENFPPKRRYGVFPSFSAGWVVSDEPWISTPDWLKILKIRGSYGTVGNDQIGGARFLFISEFGPAGGLGNMYPSGYYFGLTNNGNSATGGYGETRVGNAYVTWEKAKKANIGFDLSMFKNNALNITFDYFHEMRDNILTEAGSVPSYVGIETIAPRNSGKVLNHGLEFEVRVNKQFSRDFSFFANLQGTYAKNKVLENDQPAPAFDYQDLRGYEIGYSLGYHALGLFQDQDDIDNSPVQNFGTPIIPGDIKYFDKNEDGIINANDRVPIKCYSVPVFTGGLSFGVNWKGFDFSMMFSGALGGTARLWVYESSIMNLQRWTENNKNAILPVAHNSSNNNELNDFNLMKTDYLKLRNVELGYTIPSKYLKPYGISGTRIFLNSQNVAIWDTMWLKDRDPEAAGSGTLPYPLQRIINMGIRVEL